MEEKIWKPVYGIDGSVRMVQIPAEEETKHYCSGCGHCNCGHDEEDWDEEDWDEEYWDEDDPEELDDDDFPEGASTWEDVFIHGQSFHRFESESNDENVVFSYTAIDTNKTVLVHNGTVMVCDVFGGLVGVYELEDEVPDSELLPFDWEDEIE